MQGIKYRKLVVGLAVVSAISFTSCRNNSNDIFGTWQLKEFCYGMDCSDVAEHDIVQLWQFNNDIIETDKNHNCVYTGRQFQDGIMDNDILWSLSANNDSLFTCNNMGENPDTFLVQRLEKDTLVLSSMMNNILVQQLFVKQ